MILWFHRGYDLRNRERVMGGFLETLGQLGGAALVVGGLSAWIGKLWADRILQRENSEHQQRLKALEAELRHDVDKQLARLQTELTMLKEKTLKAHADKLACYGFAIDGASKLLADVSALEAGLPSARPFDQAFAEFDAMRIRAYGHMAMVAPQAVMDAYDSMVEYFIHVHSGHKIPDWVEARNLALAWINTARTDIGVDTTPISYRGVL